MNKVFIAIGTNLGSRKANITTALRKIKEFAKIIKKSSIYETEPVGYKDQGKFLNMAIKVETELSAIELLKKLHEIEKKMGRVRKIKNGPRIIDLDILFYNNEIIDQRNLKIPHPRLHTRNFVLIPLSEISPNIMHPKLKKDIQTLKNGLKKDRKTS